MPKGKEFVVQELSDALAVEKAIVDNERALVGVVDDAEARQALEQMVTEDEGHVANFERVIEAMGAKPVKVEADDRKMVNSLKRVAQEGEEVLERLSAHSLLKHKAVDTGELFHALAEELGKPKALTPLDVNLREDTAHAKQLKEICLKLGRQMATHDGGVQELKEAVAG